MGYDKETLIEAFRILDTEKNGYLDLHTYYTFLKRYGIAFTKIQIDDMEKFLLENANELLESLGIKNDEPKKHTPTTTRKFYYESYVRKVLGDNQKHYEDIMKEYRAFYNEYEETKKFPEMPQIVNNANIKEEANAEKPPEPKQEAPPAQGGEPKKEGEPEKKEEKPPEPEKAKA